MPYKDPEKYKRAARESMRRRRASPEAQAEERKQKAMERGGDSRSSTVYVDPTQGGKARHGHVDRLFFNYRHAEGGKPRRGDLRSLRVRRRQGDSFERRRLSDGDFGSVPNQRYLRRGGQDSARDGCGDGSGARPIVSALGSSL